MPIAFQAVTNGGEVTGGATSLTFSHTVSSGSDRALVVFVRGRAATSGAVLASSVTFNGTNLTEVAGATIYDATNQTGVQSWVLVNPTVTTANVVVTWGSATNRGGAVALSFTGVDQTTPVIASAETAFATTTNPSFSVSSTTANSWVLSNIYSNAVAGTLDAGPTQRDYTQYAASDFGGSATTATTTVTTVTHSWTHGSSESNTGTFGMVVLGEATGGGGGGKFRSYFTRR